MSVAIGFRNRALLFRKVNVADTKKTTGLGFRSHLCDGTGKVVVLQATNESEGILRLRGRLSKWADEVDPIEGRQEVLEETID